MDLQEIKTKFYRENKGKPAFFYKNDKLDQFVCFTVDYVKNDNVAFISDDLIKEISARKTTDPLSTLITYVLQKESMQKYAEVISDFYMYTVENNLQFESVEQACQSLNEYIKANHKDLIKSSKYSTITAHIIGEDGSFSPYVFKMDITFKRNKQGERFCFIEDTQTDPNFRNNGLHYAGIRFLEAYLASTNTYNIIGESDEFETFEAENGDTLARHYEKMGFQTIYTSSGKTRLHKSVDPDTTLDIYGDELTR